MDFFPNSCLMAIPSYIQTHLSGKLLILRDSLFQSIGSCTLCPRQCKINRLKEETGTCNSMKSLGMLEGIIDIYMPDLKLSNSVGNCSIIKPTSIS